MFTGLDIGHAYMPFRHSLPFILHLVRSFLRLAPAREIE